MARHNQKGRSNYPDGNFLLLSHRIIQSYAFRSLKGSALKVLIELCKRHNGTNNGTLSLSIEHCCKLLNIGKATAKRGFDELEAKGFIIKTSHGCWIKGKATEWRVTFLPHSKDGKTNEWSKWEDDHPKPEKPRKPWGHKKTKALENYKCGQVLETFPGSVAEPI